MCKLRRRRIERTGYGVRVRTRCVARLGTLSGSGTRSEETRWEEEEGAATGVSAAFAAFGTGGSSRQHRRARNAASSSVTGWEFKGPQSGIGGRGRFAKSAGRRESWREGHI